MHTSLEVDWSSVTVASPLPAIFKMKVDGGGPLGIVFLVDVDVVAVSRNKSFGGAIELNRGVFGYDVVHSQFWIVDHDVDSFFALATFHRNPDLQVMVSVAYVWNFHVVAIEFLLDFVFAVDAVFEKSTALHFPAVVDAVTGGKARAQDQAQCAHGDNGKTFQKCGFHILKIEKNTGCLKVCKKAGC